MGYHPCKWWLNLLHHIASPSMAYNLVNSVEGVLLNLTCVDQGRHTSKERLRIDPRKLNWMALREVQLMLSVRSEE